MYTFLCVSVWETEARGSLNHASHIAQLAWMGCSFLLLLVRLPVPPIHHHFYVDIFSTTADSQID